MSFFLFALVVDFVTVVLHGFALKVLWGWFMVPIFDLPNLTIPAAIGISLTISLLISRSGTGKDEDQEDFEFAIKKVVSKVISIIIALAAGWITLQFM